jgi:hypothetical protein
MTGVAIWEGTAYPCALEFTPVFSGVRDAQYVAFCGVFCKLFRWTLSFILAITFSVLRNTASQTENMRTSLFAINVSYINIVVD